MKIKFAGINVKDLDESVKFYKEVLGLIEIERFSPNDGVTIVFLKDEYSGMIELIEDKNKPKNQDIAKESIVSIVLGVLDLSEILNELKSKGVNIVNGPIEVPNGNKLLFIKDPNGVEIELIQEANTDK